MDKWVEIGSYGDFRASEKAEKARVNIALRVRDVWMAWYSLWREDMHLERKLRVMGLGVGFMDTFKKLSLGIGNGIGRASVDYFMKKFDST